jgi:hypothetical protein
MQAWLSSAGLYGASGIVAKTLKVLKEWAVKGDDANVGIDVLRVAADAVN